MPCIQPLIPSALGTNLVLLLASLTKIPEHDGEGGY